LREFSNSNTVGRDKESLSLKAHEMKLSRQLPLNALRVFEAVARLQNFTRAAEELGMTQTAASYQIKILEEHLGETVFIRKPRALQLTETGTHLLPKVAEAFDLLAEAMQAARHTIDATLDIHSITSPRRFSRTPPQYRRAPTAHDGRFGEAGHGTGHHHQNFGQAARKPRLPSDHAPSLFSHAISRTCCQHRGNP